MAPCCSPLFPQVTSRWLVLDGEKMDAGSPSPLWPDHFLQRFFLSGIWFRHWSIRCTAKALMNFISWDLEPCPCSGPSSSSPCSMPLFMIFSSSTTTNQREGQAGHSPSLVPARPKASRRLSCRIQPPSQQRVQPPRQLLCDSFLYSLLPTLASSLLVPAASYALDPLRVAGVSATASVQEAQSWSSQSRPLPSSASFFPPGSMFLSPHQALQEPEVWDCCQYLHWSPNSQNVLLSNPTSGSSAKNKHRGPRSASLQAAEPACARSSFLLTVSVSAKLFCPG